MTTKYHKIIENLGGYVAAKKHYNEVKYVRYKNIGFLEKALLEYRRENSIYEEGDKVVLIDISSTSNVFEVVNISTVGHYWTIKCSVGRYECTFIKRQIRHATDVEIKAGRRL